MMLKIVVLPQPDGPMMLTKSRSLMAKERSSSTRTSPALPAKDFRTLRTLSWAGGGAESIRARAACLGNGSIRHDGSQCEVFGYIGAVRGTEPFDETGYSCQECCRVGP